MNAIICIAASAEQQQELEKNVAACSDNIQWVSNTANLWKAQADFLIDCTFSGDTVPITNTPLLIHSPVRTLKSLQVKGKAARFCSWKTFLNRVVWDIAIAETESSEATWLDTLMLLLGKQFVVVKDEAGLIGPRIITSIIYEAAKALQSNVSTKAEINLAMKLGTNYPFGPFEWLEAIGTSQLQPLVNEMFSEDPILLENL